MYKLFFKRILDIVISFLGLVTFSPLILLLTLYLTYVNRGKPFFYQLRPGKNSTLFVIIKFRTMNDAKDSEGNLLKDSQRLTFIGKVLRRSSLDEIPQLINVFKGDMSIVGPRPLLREYLALYNDEQCKRHDVKPGITGMAQVHGRNLMLFSERFEHDVWYVKNMSFKVDIKIIWLTIKRVISSTGVVPTQDVRDVDDVGFNK